MSNNIGSACPSCGADTYDDIYVCHTCHDAWVGGKGAEFLEIATKKLRDDLYEAQEKMKEHTKTIRDLCDEVATKDAQIKQLSTKLEERIDCHSDLPDPKCACSNCMSFFLDAATKRINVLETAVKDVVGPDRGRCRFCGYETNRCECDLDALRRLMGLR